MKYWIILLMLLGPFYAFSQANYHKGSVTTADDKTLTGYIDYREWGLNPKSINFKASLDDENPVIYYPNSIRSFSVDGLKTYYSYKGNISMNKVLFPDLPSGKDTSSKNDIVFLKLITTGDNVTLLSYTDVLKTRYFIREKDGRFYELGFQRYYGGINTDIKLDNKYIGQLASLVGKYAGSDARILDKIQSVSYTEDDIESIVNMINGVSKKGASKRKTSGEPSSFRFFAGGGISVANSVFHDEINLTGASSITYTPQIGIGVDLFTNPSVQKFVFRLEVGLAYIDPELKKENKLTSLALEPYTVNAVYTYKQYNLKVTPQLIYNLYNASTLKVYIAAGIIFNFSQYSNQSYTTYSTLDPKYGAPPTVSHAIYKLDNQWLSFSGQTGVVLNKRIEVFFNYSPPMSYLSNGAGGATLQTGYYNAGVHYLF